MSLLRNAFKAIGFTIAGIFAGIMVIVIFTYALVLLFKTPAVIISLGLIAFTAWLTMKFQNDDKKKVIEAEKNGSRF